MKIAVSACLIAHPYRYDAEDVSSERVRALGRDFELIAFCPEVWAGMGVPREPIRFVKNGTGAYLLRSSDGRAFYGKIKRVVLEFLDKNPDIKVFILKSKSPSCGIGSAKVYKHLKGDAFSGRTYGVLSRELKKRNVLMVEEDSVADPDFIEVLYALKEFYTRKDAASFHRDFHRFLMKVSPYLCSKLGRLTSRPHDYERLLILTLKRWTRLGRLQKGEDKHRK